VIASPQRIARPRNPASARARWLTLAVAMCVAMTALNFLREGSPASGLMAVANAGPASAALPRTVSRPVQIQPREKSSVTDAEPVRLRDAWDFIGPEMHGRPELSLSAGVSDKAFVEVAAAWRAGDHARAAQLVKTWPELDDRRQVLTPLLWEWVETDPAAAARFAQSLAAGAERREMLEVVVREWVGRDINAAAAWLATEPLQVDADGAAAVIATNDAFSERQPEAALAWAERITAPTLRWEAATTIATTWARRDQAAMADYFERSAAFTRDERSRLLAHVRQSIASVP
jgi:hypothetical protein